MVAGTREAQIPPQFVKHCELGGPDVCKETLLRGNFYEVQIDWDMFVG